MRLDTLLIALRVPLDYLLLLLAGVCAWYLRFASPITGLRPVQFSLTLGKFLEIVIPTAALWILLFALNGLYSFEANKKFSEELKRTITACFAGLAVLALIIFFSGERFDSRFLVLASAFFATIFVLVGRLLLRLLRVVLLSAGIGSRRLLLIGASEVSDVITRALKDSPSYGYTVVKRVDTLTNSNALALANTVAKQFITEVLFVNTTDRAHATRVLQFCQLHHLTLKFLPDVFGMHQRATGVDTIAGIPIIELKRTRLEGWGGILKRLMDIIGAVFFLVTFSPIMLLAAIATLIETGFPIIFRNERVGENGRTFATLKFRSMYQHYSIGTQFKNQRKALAYEQELIATKNSKTGPLYKIQDDPRITRVGRFLRRWSIDELPQFFNVLSGSMSLVGPRPHQIREVAGYAPEHREVHNVRPGITGLAQISGRSDLSFEDEIRLDTFYIENWSLLMDIAILIKTPWAVLRRRKVE
ncbi:MAG: sugar transferase [Patescibacteria group bacterium]